jgi:pantothenate synthetase
VDRHNLDWFAARLLIVVYDLNREYRMSVEVKGLAETVRKAKAAISKASTVSSRMQVSAERLTETLAQVEDMTSQLDTAQAELQGAVGQLSNGGPPLDEPEPEYEIVELAKLGLKPEEVEGMEKSVEFSAPQNLQLSKVLGEVVSVTPAGGARSVTMLNSGIRGK